MNKKLAKKMQGKKKKNTSTLIIFVLILFLIFCLFFGNEKNKKNFKVNNVISMITLPFQKNFYSTSYAINKWIKNNFNSKELVQKNLQLQNEVNFLRKQLVEFNRYKLENKELLKLLQAKKINNSLKFLPSLVVGKISNSPYKSFIIDKGSNDGVKAHNAVVTSEGLVGYIDKVFLNSSVVKTILDNEVNIGVYNTSNGESGMLTGTINLAYKNLTKMRYLSRQTSAKSGDVLITSGTSDDFPKGVLVGKITGLQQESHSTSVFALIEPFCDFNNLKHIFIVTSFLNDFDVSDSDFDFKNRENESENLNSEADSPANQADNGSLKIGISR